MDMKRWIILFFAALFFSSHALADGCSRRFTITANNGCESHLQAAYQQELAPLFEVVNDDRVVVVGVCTCTFDRTLVSCSAHYSAHSCLSTKSGKNYYSADPVFRGEIHSSSQVHPRNPYQDLTKLQRHATRSAASDFLQKVINR